MSNRPAIEILNWTNELATILPGYVLTRRWYRSKTRTIERLTIQDIIPVVDPDTFILVLRIEYAEKDHDDYILPVVLRGGIAAADELIGLVGEGGLYSAVSDAGFRQALLNLIASDRALKGQLGTLIGRRTAALDDPISSLKSFVSRAEQSNTSIVYGDRYILKLFRKLEPGINPDIEIGSFLTQRGFKNTPAVLGSIEYKFQSGESCATGILQQFVPNEGDAWSYTLKSLREFFERASGADRLIRAGRPRPASSDSAASLGDYADSAALLGKRTAEMHAAFEDKNAGPDFIPEPFTSQDSQKLYRDLLSQADIAFEALRRKQAILAGPAAEAAREILRLEPEVTAKFDALRNASISAVRIRHHGDYHLGQVLYTGSDFMIIDFEGEPARPLSERRKKALAMRDVAGMVRSFQYAAYAALFESEAEARLDASAEFWTQSISAIYLKAYFSAGSGLRCIPSSAAEQKLLLDVFLLQKALYELAYELNNRPDWVLIPLRGILSLMIVGQALSPAAGSQPAPGQHS